MRVLRAELQIGVGFAVTDRVSLGQSFLLQKNLQRRKSADLYRDPEIALLFQGSRGKLADINRLVSLG